MFHGNLVTVIIPALNEAGSIAQVIGAIDRTLVDEIVVGDNGSTDGTAAVATAAGAKVVAAPRRGYGTACLGAIAAARPSDIFVFLDADGSDDASEISLLLEAMHRAGADIVIGSRVTGTAEPGSLSPVQRFGNALTCALVRWLWGVHYTDLGPFRAIRRLTYERLQMQDPDFGWTIEMQVKAARLGLPVAEVPVTYRNRQAGHSKVSGNLRGSWLAGKRILGFVFAAKITELIARWQFRG